MASLLLPIIYLAFISLGWVANHISPALFPHPLLVLLVLMVVMHEQLTCKTACR